MDKGACLKALGARKIAFAPVPHARGVAAPVRLAGALAGVAIRSEAPAIERGASPAEVFDCRLVLALHEWARDLAAAGVDEVRIASAWRPPSASWAKGAPAHRHPGGLAVDVKAFGMKLAKGETKKRWLSVERDFHGRIGAPVCRAEAGRAALAGASRELRAIVCNAHDRRFFTSILTPNYDRAHRDHLHLELRRGVSWSLFL
jgi:hypothetical protein